MTNFNKTVLTNAGLKFLGKEGISTEFVRVETGSGIYVENENVAAQTELKSKVQELGISSVSMIAENKIRLKFVVSNKELDTTYLFTEIGVYANDPDEGEILYAICYATEENAEKIQKYNGIFESTIAISLGIEVDNAGNVSFETQGAYALVEDLLDTERRLGDTLNELDVSTQKQRYYYGGGISGQGGYVAFAQIKILAKYANTPIEFTITRRHGRTPCRVSIRFANADNTDPLVEALEFMGNDYEIFAHKVDTSTWLLYYKKSELYDNVNVHEVHYEFSHFEITYPGTFITEKPTDAIDVTLGYSVEKAEKDIDGNNIPDTYFKKTGGTINGNTTIEKADDSQTFLALKNNKRHATMEIAGGGNVGMYDQSNKKWIFDSDLDGNASFYGNADSATKDAEGNNIPDTYATKEEFNSHVKDTVSHITSSERAEWNNKSVVSLSRSLTSGTKVGSITVNGTTYDLYCQTNTDTWRGIQNNLTSDSTTDSLSAAQGKALKELVDAKAERSHMHDRVYSQADSDYYVICTAPQGSTHVLFPSTTKSIDLGWSYVLWKDIYASNSTISTSDRNEKNSISYIGVESEYEETALSDDDLVSFVNRLMPVVYKFNDGTSNRPHHGMISQDVENILQDMNIDHAGFIKSPKFEKYIDEDGTEQYKQIEGEYVYSLRYEEFIADIIRFVQILYKRDLEKEKKLSELEERLSKLEILQKEN